MATVTKPMALDESLHTTEQTSRNIADVLADELANIANAIGGGSGSGGHIIQNADGTDLAQRAKLQFGGMLKATDDSTNGVTKVSDLAEKVEWSVWNAMSEAEQDAYSAGKKLDIINVPSVSGSIPVELIKTLWTNPSPTSAFAAQTITLASDDYDLLLTIYAPYIGRVDSTIVTKGSNMFLNLTTGYRGNENIRSRAMDYVSDTQYTAQEGKLAQASETTANNACIPIVIYGIKSSVNVDMSALVANVSTSASKCMLSDGETSVEDAIDKVGKRTKLWENPNPSADFSPTSIAVGENYDQMMIVADSNTLYVSNTLGATTSMFLGTIGGVSYGFTRRFAYQGGNVIIQDGYSYKISDGTRATNNSIIIPLAIYGIKY